VADGPASSSKERRFVRADGPTFGRHLFFALERVEQGTGVAVIEPGIEEDAFARAGDGCEDRVWGLIDQGLGIGGGTDRQRQKILMAIPVVELRLDDRQKQRLRSASQKTPVDEPRLAGATRFSGEPSLAHQERDQQILFNQRSDVSVEERFPRGADEQRRRL